MFKWNRKQMFGLDSKFGTADSFIVFAFAVISFGMHFWTVQLPMSVVFDEVHFGNFTNWYTKSQFFFDIHPPLAKLIMFMFANLSEYDGLVEFAKSGNPRTYENGTYVPLRITPAFFGSMCSPLVYLAVRFSAFSKCAAFAAASLVCFDTSLLAEQRFILSDGILLFFSCLHVTIMCYSLSVDRGSAKFRIWLIISGLSLGAAGSCKNTAWGLCLLNGIVHFVDLALYFDIFSWTFAYELFYRGVTLICCFLVMYIGSFAIHFSLLPFNGQGSGYMTPDLRRQLIPQSLACDEIWSPRVVGRSLISRSVILSVLMHGGNMKITNFHQSQSFPSEWPLLSGIRVLFWSSGSKEGEEISCVGNAFCYYLTFLGIVAVTFAFKSERWFAGMVFVVGWAVSYLPFFLIPRVMYLYHYHIPLVLASMAFGAALDLFVPKFPRGFVSVIAAFLGFVGFVLWGSFCYGSVPWDRNAVIWDQRWVSGGAAHKSSASGRGHNGLHYVG